MFFTTVKAELCERVTPQQNESETYLVKYLATELFEIPILLIGLRRYSPSNKPLKIERKQVTLFGLYLTFKNVISIMIVILLALQINAFMEDKKIKQQMLFAPKVGDLYFANVHLIDKTFEKRYPYNILAVSHVNDGEIVLRSGAKTYQDPISPFSYLTEGYYTGESMLTDKTVSFDLSKLKGLYESGVIYNMKRPVNGYIDGWLSIRLLRKHDDSYQFEGASRYRKAPTL